MQEALMSFFYSCLGCTLLAFSGVKKVMRSSMEKRGVENSNYLITKKYPLRGYDLSVLMHTTPRERHWGGDETLN